MQATTDQVITGHTLPLPDVEKANGNYNRRQSLFQGHNEPVLMKIVNDPTVDPYPIAEPAPFGLVCFAFPTLLFAFKAFGVSLRL